MSIEQQIIIFLFTTEIIFSVVVVLMAIKTLLS